MALGVQVIGEVLQGGIEKLGGEHQDHHKPHQRPPDEGRAQEGEGGEGGQGEKRLGAQAALRLPGRRQP